MPAPHLNLVVSEPAGKPAPARRRPIGEILLQQGSVNADQVAAALALQEWQGARLGNLLRIGSGLTEQELLSGLEGQWGCRRIDLLSLPPDPVLIDRLGVQDCLRQLFIPWRHIGARTVIAAVHPDSFEAERPRLEAIFGPVMLALASEEDLHECLARLYAPQLSRAAEARVAVDQSCRGWRGDRFQVWAGSAAGLCLLGLIARPAATLAALSILAALVLLAVNGLKLLAAIAAFERRKAEPAENVVELASVGARQPVVSILVPLFKEQRIAERLVERLAALTYPPALLDICLIVEADDAVTEGTLARCVLPGWMRTIRVPRGTLRTKPRAMNYALDFCRGSIVGIYDAEDAPAPDQIDRVVAEFATAPPEIACLQGRLGFYNARRNWMSRCFALDYAAWFSMILPGLARLDLPVPLGGTTLFFRRAALERLGAWDAHNVTEDADLGVRLHRHGYRTALIDTETGEEAACNAWPWIRQRSRWIKGYAMTYATHMRAPARLWADLGPWAFLGFQILFLGSLLQAVLAPVIWSWWLLWLGQLHPLNGHLPPLLIHGLATALLAVEFLNIGIAVTAARRTGQGWLIPWALTLNLYNMLATLAGYKAMAEMIRKPFFWDKTAHGIYDVPQAGPDAAPA